MASYLKQHKKRVGLGSKSFKEFTTREIERNFEEYLMSTPTGHEIKITDPDEILITDKTKTVLCAIHDLTNNDKRALDEKQILVLKDCNIDVGCYLFWDNCYWIIVFKEHRTIDSHKKFIIKRCNQIVNYKYNGVVYPIPVSIENLTMYSDGLADLKFTSQQDSKRMITFGSNPITRTVVANTRVMLTGKTVFRVTHINDFEYNGAYTGAEGIIKTLVLQTTLIDEDDLVNNTAWNENSEKINKGSDTSQKILGEKKIMIGSKKKYRANNIGSDISWKVEQNKPNTDFMKYKITEKNELEVELSPNVNFVGDSFKIVLYNKNTQDELDSLEVEAKGFM